MYNISSVHHVAVGVRDMERMKTFYRDILEFTEVIGDFAEEEHPPMRNVVRANRTVFSGYIFKQLAGEIFVELIHMSEPVPRPLRNNFRYGDTGVAKITIAVRDVEKIYSELKDTVNFCSTPKRVSIPGQGEHHFVYFRDPEGNLIEFVTAKDGRKEDKFNGVIRIGISVTDLQRSIAFYQKYLGFNHFVADIHENYSGLVDEIAGGGPAKIRSCILSNGKSESALELFEVTEPRGRSIPLAARWGDFGYLQACVLCDNVDAVAEHCEKEEIDLLCGIERMDTDKPEEAGAFIYIKDPDGIPLEFLNIIGHF
jgi:catechol 2,3-dioxygenase-like lactoylglutathione lyase family enzyme